MGCVGTRDDQVPEGQGDCGALVGYVDDGAYSYASEDPATLSNTLSSKYCKLAEWMNSNKLVINADKTHLIVMGTKKHRDKRKQVVMRGQGTSLLPQVRQRSC